MIINNNMHTMLSLPVLISLLLASSCSAESLYPRSSAVLQLSAKTFDDKVKNTYNASIVEFYAPWCGHCKNLQPAYEKAAKNLEGIAQVAAINCDDEDNKEFCGRMGVKGFPTLKTVRPTGIFGKPIISDYNGARSANDIVEAMKGLLPNHVTRLQNKDWDSWLEKKNETAKAILFSDKGTTSALIKSLANDFFDSIEIAQVRDKETEINKVFDVTKYPTLVVLPGGDQQAIVYDGDLKRVQMLAFLSQYGSVRAPPSKAAKKSKTSSKPDKKASSAFSKASKSQASEEASSSAATGSTVILEEPVTESPNPIVDTEATPVPVASGPEPIASLDTQEDLATKCLGQKTNTCVLVLLPTGESTEATTALASFASLSDKHRQRGVQLFPFYAVSATNPGTEAIRKALEFEAPSQTQIIAVNGKRNWWRHFDSSSGFDVSSIETWIDAVRFGDIKKNKLPGNIFVVSETSSASTEEPSVAHGEL